MHSIRKEFIAILAIIFFTVSCKQNNETTVSPVQQKTENKEEQKHEPKLNDTPPPVSYNYIQVKNNRYQFTFDMPESWKAVDKSNNGDGYYLDAGDVNVDFRIYGETLTGVQDIDNAGVTCDAVAEFVFTDGTKGTKCTDSGLLYFFYTQKKKRVTMYVNAPVEWKKKNVQAINHIAQSISMQIPS